MKLSKLHCKNPQKKIQQYFSRPHKSCPISKPHRDHPGWMVADPGGKAVIFPGPQNQYYHWPTEAPVNDDALEQCHVDDWWWYWGRGKQFMSSVLGIRCVPESFPITESSGLGLSVGMRKQTPAAIVINDWSWEPRKTNCSNWIKFRSNWFTFVLASLCWMMRSRKSLK